MSDQSPENKQKASSSRIMFAIFAVLAAAAAIYVMSGRNGNEQKQTEQASSAQSSAEMPANPLAHGQMKNFVFAEPRREIAKVEFADGEGGVRDLSQWKGKVVLLNLWATWCAPCRKEMPALSRLQEDLGSDQFEVVALSVDTKGLEASRKFLTSIDAKALALYVDETAEALQKIRGIGLPVTVLIDRDGKEVGRLTGPAEWDSPEAKALINSVVEPS